LKRHLLKENFALQISNLAALQIANLTLLPRLKNFLITLHRFFLNQTS